MDYRELLVKYMAHVVDSEGVAFLPDPGTLIVYARDEECPRFTLEEAEELERVSAEADKRYLCF